jgi:stage III sporulation protein AE
MQEYRMNMVFYHNLKRKWLFPFLLTLLAGLFFARPGWAADLTRDATETLDLTELNRFLGTMESDIDKLLPQLDPKAWETAGPEWDLPAMGRSVLQYFVREILFNLRLLGELALLALALAILENMNHAFAATTVNQIAFAICFLLVIGIVMNSFRVTFAIAKDLVGEMTGFMYAITPAMFSLIAAAGGMSTTLIVHPLLISAIGMVAGLVNYIILPLILFSGVLGVVNFFQEGFQVKKLAALFKKAALGLMGLAMALFIGLVTIRGFTASVADSAALRTAKYCSNTFLPVVGGVLADTMEMAVGCSTVVKSGLGVFGLVLIILIAVFPLIKILTVAIVYHLTGAILQPLGNVRLADALETVGDTFFNLFGALAVVALMFFIAIAVLIGIANFGRIG